VYTLVGYTDQTKHNRLAKDKSLPRTYIPNHADNIIAVTDEQFVLIKLAHPDIEILGIYSFPLDYFK
tara:strand:+ start:525 stop:725 length:201 start_codon:yes stop_codon:yes gene_type:complete